MQNQEKNIFDLLIQKILQRNSSIECTGFLGAERAFFLYELFKQVNLPIVVMAPSQKEAKSLIDDFRFFSDAIDIDFFPPYNILPFKYLSYHNETAAERIRTLYKLCTGDSRGIIVTTADAVVQKLIPRSVLSNYAELLMVNEDFDREHLVEKLVSGGYTHSAIVEEPGDYCVRGGILDVFSPMYGEPVRIEFFGDMVESIRFFSSVNQRTLENIFEAIILPVRESVIYSDHIDDIAARIRRQVSVQEISVTKAREIIDRLKTEKTLPGIDNLLPLIYSDLDSFFDYIPQRFLTVLIEPADSKQNARKWLAKAHENYSKAKESGELCIEPDTLFLEWSRIESSVSKQYPIILKTIPSSTMDDSQPEQETRTFHFTFDNNVQISQEIRNFKDKETLLSPLIKWINGKKEAGYSTYIVCSTRAQAERLRFMLSPYGLHPTIEDTYPEETRIKDVVKIVLGHISSGFSWPENRIALITEDEIYGAKHHRKRKAKRKIRTELLALEDLKEGDLVVHSDHGIGRYEGLMRLKLDGIVNELISVIYHDDDKLYLPVDRLNMVQKYVGVDETIPMLDKMGGKSWDRVKSKAKKSAEKIAKELLELYAKRKVAGGYAFSEPDGYYRDFEAGFPYEETEDQLKAIDEVIGDMVDAVPMDRLICGDVGYGKTEVALRASFVAVNNGKQVAVLVPTTVLAEQHFATFKERFKPYPVKIDCLNRFRTTAEQRKTLNELKEGKIDIVIGTHRLLSKDVAFKELGLIVIDEEQRFGVKQKETLKKLRSTVDVLALTATPIPRTLHLSLMGIRDITMISTPPEHRHSIVTYICDFDIDVIAEAIRKEIERNGQIYFVHNTIRTIESMAKKLKDAVPEVRLDVAHGRMDEKELERVMMAFINKDIDMLVCTSIIESGLDIPSANTILINRADRFGLAQIYQLRGRVGRADEQAYAYLIIPDETILTKDAKKRLKVLMEHSDLGAGFQIAMSDLKIRGGGAILGVSQSGHIAAVGYDMFLQLMEESISQLKGEERTTPLSPEINMPMSAYISETYIPEGDQRFDIYRRLSRVTELKEISNIKSEMTDRFGTLPEEAANLLLKIMLKVLSIKSGVKRLELSGEEMILYFSDIHMKNPEKLIALIRQDSDRFEWASEMAVKIKFVKRENMMVQARNVLKEFAQCVND